MVASSCDYEFAQHRSAAARPLSPGPRSVGPRDQFRLSSLLLLHCLPARLPEIGEPADRALVLTQGRQAFEPMRDFETARAVQSVRTAAKTQS
jgi:hypothetical protein